MLQVPPISQRASARVPAGSLARPQAPPRAVDRTPARPRPDERAHLPPALAGGHVAPSPGRPWRARRSLTNGARSDAHHCA